MPATHMSGKRTLPPDIRAVTGAKDRSARKKAGTDHADSVPGTPQCPFWFSQRAHDIWLQFCHVLEARGQLCQDDYWAMCALVSTFEEWENLRKLVNENGYTQNVRTSTSNRKSARNARDDDDDDDGMIMARVRPEVKLLRETEVALRQWLCEFGLTAVTRIKAPKVGKNGADEVNALSEWGLS